MSNLEIGSSGYGICNQTTFNSPNNLVTRQYLTTVISNSNLVGEVKMYTGKTTPNGWLFCDGSSLLRSAYPDLSNVIGSTYGGTTTNFNLPDFKSKVPICSQQLDPINITYQGTSVFSGGNKNMTTEQLVSHSHKIGDHTHTSNSNYRVFYYDNRYDYLVASGRESNQPEAKNYSNSVNTDTGTTTLTSGNGGGTSNGATQDFLPPFCVVNFIIYTGK